MNGIKGLAIVLLLAGVLGLAYGGITYTKSSHEGHIGSLALEVQHKKTVNFPVWASVIAVVLGAGLLVVPMKK